MNLILVSSLFFIWFSISLIYAFYQPKKNVFHSFLVAYSWIGRWNMFIPDHNRKKHSYAVSYRDIDESNNIGNWNLMNHQKWNPYIFIVNVEGRMLAFSTFNARRMILTKNSNIKDLNKTDSFKFLCKIACDMPATPAAKFRQVKFEYISNNICEIQVLSEFFAL